MRGSILNRCQISYLIAAMALPGILLQATPASALPHCEGYTLEELYAMEPAQQIQWLTEELAQCDSSVESQAIHYSNRGLAYFELDEFELAIADYDQAIALDPDFARAYYNRASAECNLVPRRTELALEDILMAVQLEPQKAIELQEFLRDEGLYAGAIDGNFLPPSQAAFSAWCDS